MASESGRSGGLPDGVPERIGPFRLLECIGGGGMGLVFRALEEPLRREVALKIMRPEALECGAARERFRRETLAVASLRHEGIVPVFAVGEDGALPWFTMELIEGETLAAGLERVRGRAPESLAGPDLAPAFRGTWPEACLAVARQVAAALAHAHEHGVLHRDVKPSNVVLAPNGRARLLDFGLTSSAGGDRLTRTGTQVGTLLYMAPEQLRGEGDLDARTDVYSLCATLYELLALQPPFEGRNVLETQERIAAGGAPDLRARNRAVPADAAVVVACGMDPERGRRYAGAAALARDLGNVLEHRPIAARPAGAWLLARRYAERNPGATAAIVLGALLLAGLPTAISIQRARAAAAEARLSAKARAEAATAERSLALLEKVLLGATPYLAPGREPTVADVLEHGLRDIEADLERDPKLRARLLQTLGEVSFHFGRFAEAERRLQQVAADLSAVDEIEGAADARCTEMLGRLALAQNDRERSAELLRQAARLYAERLGPDSEPERLTKSSLATALANSANLDPTRMQEALDLSREIIDSANRSGANDSDALQTAWTLLAGAHEQRGEFDEADRITLAELERVRAHDPDGDDCAQALIAAARVHQRRGRDAEAEQAFLEAVATYERLHDRPHPDLVIPLLNFAAFLHDRGRIAEAEPLYRRSLDIAREFLAETEYVRVIVALSLAQLLFGAGRDQEVMELYREVLPFVDRALPATDISRGTARCRFGLALARTGDSDGAERELRASVAIHEGQGRRALPFLRASRDSLTGLLAERGRTEDARAVLEASIAEARAATPPEPQRLRELLGHLAEACERLGDAAGEAAAKAERDALR